MEMDCICPLCPPYTECKKKRKNSCFSVLLKRFIIASPNREVVYAQNVPLQENTKLGLSIISIALRIHKWNSLQF